ncbi:nucleotidyltransferase family protein [Devosia sp. PTR5]|uniref:Nucleotidyltransferase family protein n=1 Tax=Devosia oryzisoli TaxID=2774138 RepID=A0A927FW24_9HYPH|nr:nucleotidyltransferase family protein [Devosia oryzisoli]MBD8066372.1 nucleotidyltransferase family protein [Devosia oryzisoli]
MPSRFPDIMLLAAGLGRRLRPLTDSTPKPLIRVGGIPLIERVMASARAEGATRFTANAHHHADQVLAHFAGLLKVNREDVLLDTGGGVKAALTMVHSDPFFVMNTDAFWPAGIDRPLARMIERHEPGSITLLCVQPHRATGFGRSHDFCLAPSGEITPDYGAPVIYAGVVLMGKSAFANTPEGPFSLLTLFEAAQARETLRGVMLDAPWYHVGDPKALTEAEQALSA